MATYKTGVKITDDIRDSDDIKLYPSNDSDYSEIGQGDSDTDITYMALRNENGTLVYIYPNAAGNGVTVSTSKP